MFLIHAGKGECAWWSCIFRTSFRMQWSTRLGHTFRGRTPNDLLFYLFYALLKLKCELQFPNLISLLNIFGRHNRFWNRKTGSTELEVYAMEEEEPLPLLWSLCKPVCFWNLLWVALLNFLLSSSCCHMPNYFFLFFVVFFYLYKIKTVSER